MRRLALSYQLTLTLTLHIDTEMKVDFRSCSYLHVASKDDHVRTSYRCGLLGLK